jgi:hypothetical protein
MARRRRGHMSNDSDGDREEEIVQEDLDPVVLGQQQNIMDEIAKGKPPQVKEKTLETLKNAIREVSSSNSEAQQGNKRVTGLIRSTMKALNESLFAMTDRVKWSMEEDPDNVIDIATTINREIDDTDAEVTTVCEAGKCKDSDDSIGVQRKMKKYLKWGAIKDLGSWAWNKFVYVPDFAELKAVVKSIVGKMMSLFKKIIEMLAEAIKALINNIFHKPDLSYFILNALVVLKKVVFCGGYETVLAEAAMISGTNVLMDMAESNIFGRAVVSMTKAGFASYTLSNLKLQFKLFDNMPFPLNIVGTVIDSFLSYATSMIEYVIDMKVSSVMALVGAVGVILNGQNSEQIKRLEKQFHSVKLLSQLVLEC